MTENEGMQSQKEQMMNAPRRIWRKIIRAAHTYVHVNRKQEAPVLGQAANR
jgi:hypothetical protein